MFKIKLQYWWHTISEGCVIPVVEGVGYLKNGGDKNNAFVFSVELCCFPACVVML